MRIFDEELDVIIEKKKIKNIYFKIDDKLRIIISVPFYVSEKDAMKILNNNIPALERMYKKAKKNALEVKNVYYLGDEYEYIYSDKIKIDDEGFIAYGPSINMVNEYLENHSLKFFETRLAIYKDTFDNLPDFRLRVRKMKTRWGVCNKKSMTVTLNKTLIHKKIYLIDYVICHELSHFKYMDHSKNFWKCVEEHYPLYKKARSELK